MNLEEIRDMVAHQLATLAKDGDPVPTHLHAHGLDLGLDVQAIIDNPDKHIQEHPNFG